MALDLSKIKQVPLPDNQYYKEVFPKKQIYLHHTVSGDGYDGDLSSWRNTPEKVATCVVVERNGDIIQCFSSKYWAHHLGVKSTELIKHGIPANRNLELNQSSIGIEIDSWGGLCKTDDGKFYPATWDGSKFAPNVRLREINPVNVIEYPNGFRGFKYFEKYTEAQINSVRDLLVYWCDFYKISKKEMTNIFDINKDAYNLVSGIFTHVSVRSDKSDCHPQPELIQMLKSL